MKILVTSGPTREPIDPVRFISNRSTGKMGHAIVSAALARGHKVVLVSGPASIAAPAGARCVNVTTAVEMLDAVRKNFEWCDALVMAAAVSDWRPRTVSARKIKKTEKQDVIELERNPDILESIRPFKGERLIVGFAAETEDAVNEGRRKLRAKGLDMIVVNDVSMPDSGFEVDTNRVTLVTADGVADDWPLLSKDEVAARIIALVEKAGRNG